MSEIYNDIPQHVAIIMDGNGRWAKERHLPRLAGHNMGAKAVEKIFQAAMTLGVKYLTLYAFSTENWNRPKSEIDGLMKLLEQSLVKYAKDAKKHNIRLVISGSQQELPPSTQQEIIKATEATKSNTGLVVNLALNYGARQEITQAVNALLKENKTVITMEDIQQKLFQPSIPDPELIIRTSGEERLSNFLLWQAAYSEFYFTSVLWPDFSEDEFKKAITTYQQRKRRFGGI